MVIQLKALALFLLGLWNQMSSLKACVDMALHHITFSFAPRFYNQTIEWFQFGIVGHLQSPEPFIPFKGTCCIFGGVLSSFQNVRSHGVLFTL